MCIIIPKMPKSFHLFYCSHLLTKFLFTTLQKKPEFAVPEVSLVFDASKVFDSQTGEPITLRSPGLKDPAPSSSEKNAELPNSSDIPKTRALESSEESSTTSKSAEETKSTISTVVKLLYHQNKSIQNLQKQMHKLYTVQQTILDKLNTPSPTFIPKENNLSSVSVQTVEPIDGKCSHCAEEKPKTVGETDGNTQQNRNENDTLADESSKIFEELHRQMPVIQEPSTYSDISARHFDMQDYNDDTV